MAGVNGIRELPGSVVPEVADSTPARVAIPDYFADDERQFALPIHRPSVVSRVSSDGSRLCAVTSVGDEYSARAVINATGT